VARGVKTVRTDGLNARVQKLRGPISQSSRPIFAKKKFVELGKARDNEIRNFLLISEMYIFALFRVPSEKLWPFYCRGPKYGFVGDTSSETRMYSVDMDGKGRWWMSLGWWVIV